MRPIVVVFRLLIAIIIVSLFQIGAALAGQSPTCPCTIWPNTAAPATPDAGTGPSLEVGVKFTTSSNGVIGGIRFYKGVSNTGTHVGHLWTSTGTLLASVTFTGETASGWQQANFSSPVAVTANTVYVASYFIPSGDFAVDRNYFATTGVNNPPLQALVNGGSGGTNGVFTYGSTSQFPVSSYLSSNYWVDVVFNTALAVTTTSPLPGGTQGAAYNQTLAATGGTSPYTWTLATGSNLPAGLALSAGGVISGTPTVTGTTSFTVQVTDSGGPKQTAQATLSITLAPDPPPPSCPCTIWPNTAAPGTPDTGVGPSLEVGVKFTTSSNGQISGIRFYKGVNNTGTHVGNLWSSTGTLLASVTFTGETASGWQQANFSSPVAVTTNTVYVASYFIPSGDFAVDRNYFATTGVNNPPLQALVDGGIGGADGVFTYGSTSQFPVSSYLSSNYWVDVVFNSNGTLPPLVVTTTSPLPTGTQGTAYNQTLAATGGTSPYTWTLATGSNLPAGLTLSAGGAISGTPTVTGTTSFTVQVNDSSSPKLTAQALLSMTIVPQSTTCPCTIWPSTAAPGTPDTGTGPSLEVGVKFTASSSGLISSIRFYKGVNNTGTHIGHLWSSTGTLLASVTFTGETASGWQQANFSSPVVVTANTVYVASYFIPSGDFAVDRSYFAATGVNRPPLQALVDGGIGGANGVFTYGSTSQFPVSSYLSSNYWVDVVFNTSGTGSGVGVSISPKRGGVAVTQPLALTATVTNDVNSAGVTWSVSTGGTLSQQTTSTATFSAAAAGVYTVTATSKADGTKTAVITIGVTDLAGVTTYHNNLSRDGTNTREYALTTTSVTTGSFGKLFACPIDAPAYAQPLWVANLNIGGANHNVVYVATEHNTMYAFDADNPSCVNLWGSPKSLMLAGETYVNFNDLNSTDIYPDIGITGTPVIDLSTQTLYVVSKSKNNSSTCAPASTCHQRLHALSLIDGSEKFGGPANIDGSITIAGTGDGSSNGVLPFNPSTENQRPGLALVNGVVYITWASHGDIDPYHGWVIGYSAGNLGSGPVAVWNSTPNSVANFTNSRGGIWMSGGAPAADSSHNLYFLTGNGSFDANIGGKNYGDSTVKLSTTSGLSVAGYFTPNDQSNLYSGDLDHGAGGAAILVDQPSGPVQHLLIGGGKEGLLFLLNRDNLGQFSSTTNNVVQSLNFGQGIFATAAFWNNNLYLAGISGSLQQYTFNPGTGLFNTAPAHSSSTNYNFPGATPSVSSTGTSSNGIVWALDNSQFGFPEGANGPAVLHAYDATNVFTELWNSSQNPGDGAGNAVKFTVPTVANAKVYVGTRSELDVYGLLPN